MAATLRQGSRGHEVAQLQQLLKDAGLDPGAIDGVFGPQTAAAVAEYQRSHAITDDGVVGPQTWAKVNEFGAKKGQYGKDIQQGPAAQGSSVQDADLGPDLLNQFAEAEEGIKLEYELARDNILYNQNVRDKQKRLAIEALYEQTEMKLRALREQFQDVLKKTPEQFAARGLYRSGLLLSKLQEIEEHRGRQIRDVEQARGMTEADILEKNHRAYVAMQRQMKEAEMRKTFGMRQLDLKKEAKKAQLATELEELGDPVL